MNKIDQIRTCCVYVSTSRNYDTKYIDAQLTKQNPFKRLPIRVARNDKIMALLCDTTEKQ